MKVTIEVDTDDEVPNKAMRMMQADDAFGLLWDMDEVLRNLDKHGIPEGKSAEDIVIEIRTMIAESNLMRLWE